MIQLGVRLTLHKLAGFEYQIKQQPEQAPLPNDNLDALVDNLIEWRNRVKEYAKDKPGVADMLDYAVNQGKALDGMAALSDLVPGWDSLSRGQKAWLGRQVSDTYKWAYGKEPPTTYLKVKGTQRPIKAYPFTFQTQIDSCIKLMNEKF